MNGEYLEKVNMRSSGKAKRFFKLCPDGTLRWSHKEADIKNPKKYKSGNKDYTNTQISE